MLFLNFVCQPTDRPIKPRYAIQVSRLPACWLPRIDGTDWRQQQPGADGVHRLRFPGVESFVRRAKPSHPLARPPARKTGSDPGNESEKESVRGRGCERRKLKATDGSKTRRDGYIKFDVAGPSTRPRPPGSALQQCVCRRYHIPHIRQRRPTAIRYQLPALAATAEPTAEAARLQGVSLRPSLLA